jgi:hypothetical protein
LSIRAFRNGAYRKFESHLTFYQAAKNRAAVATTTASYFSSRHSPFCSSTFILAIHSSSFDLVAALHFWQIIQQ